MTLPNPIEPGIYFDVPDAEYRKAPGISQTELKDMGWSAAHLKHSREHPTKPTRPMQIGNIGHSLLLTPNAPQTWAVSPPGHDGKTKAGKEWKAANEGKLQVSYEEFEDIQGAVAAAKAHPLLSMSMDGAPLEVSVFSIPGSLLKKGRIDIIPPGPAIADCKFVEDARESQFAKLVGDLFYFVQGAYYIDLYNEQLPAGEEPKTKFLFFAVEKTPPYAINTFDLAERDIQRGRAIYQRYLDILGECRASDKWDAYHRGSSYSRTIKTLNLNSYTRKRIDESFLCL